MTYGTPVGLPAWGKTVLRAFAAGLPAPLIAGTLFHSYPWFFACLFNAGGIAALVAVVLLGFAAGLCGWLCSLLFERVYKAVVDGFHISCRDDVESVAPVAIAIVVTLFAPFPATLGYRARLDQQKSIIEDRLAPIVAAANGAVWSEGGQAPVRPFIVLRSSAEDGVRLPDRYEVNYELDGELLGDLAPGVNPAYKLLPPQTDFSRVRSVVLVADRWTRTGRQVELDVGTAPEEVNSVQIFVIDLRAQRIVWSSDVLHGGRAPRTYKGGGPGGMEFVNRIRGEKVRQSAIDDAMKHIPWRWARE